MDTTAWIVTLLGLAAMVWVVWYFWLYEPPAKQPVKHENPGDAPH
jgi:copper chaperone